MPEKADLFESPYEWRNFTNYLIKENRYVLNERWQRFIQSILHTSKKREYVLKAGRILARARIGINASDDKTAIAEVRPWRCADISVGYFKILNDQRIIDLTKAQREWILPHVFGESLTPDQLEESIWASINGTFSQPVSPQDQALQYVPSQYLAEVFKLHGFDGIGYRSSLNNNGFNIVLFNSKCAKLRYCQIFRADDIEYKFSKSDGPFSYKDQ